MGAFSKYSEMLLFSLTERVYKVDKNSQITYRTSSVNTEATSIGGQQNTCSTMEIKAGKIFIFIDWCLRESGYMPFSAVS